MSDPLTIGTIVITAIPALLPGIVNFIKNWAARGANKTVKFKGKIGNQSVEFEGSTEELEKLLEQLSKTTKPKTTKTVKGDKHGK